MGWIDVDGDDVVADLEAPANPRALYVIPYSARQADSSFVLAACPKLAAVESDSLSAEQDQCGLNARDGQLPVGLPLRFRRVNVKGIWFSIELKKNFIQRIPELRRDVTEVCKMTVVTRAYARTRT